MSSVTLFIISKFVISKALLIVLDASQKVLLWHFHNDVTIISMLLKITTSVTMIIVVITKYRELKIIVINVDVTKIPHCGTKLT